MLSSGLLCYRLLCFLGYVYTAYWLFEARPTNVTLQKSVIMQTRFLTIDTLLLQIVYYALAILLMPTKCNKTKSTLSCLALTTATTVTILFWGLYFYDKEMLASKEKLDEVPLWFIHVTHTLVSVTALFDILIARPQSAPFFISLLSVFAFFLAYVAYAEYFIYMEKVYAYPLMKMFSASGRYGFYGTVFVGIFIVFMVSLLTIKFSSVEVKRKPRNHKTKAKKPQQHNQQQPSQQQQSQHQQAQKHSPAQNVNTKKKKQSKQD